MQKNFDEKTISKVAYNYTEITQPASLGPESGQSIDGMTRPTHPEGRFTTSSRS